MHSEQFRSTQGMKVEYEQFFYSNLCQSSRIYSMHKLHQPYMKNTTFIKNQEISAAVLNISGRQGLLCQQAALFALRLVCTQDMKKQETLCQKMLATIDLMERSHYGLINGDAEMELPGQPSELVWAMCFEEPLNIDRQIRDYIAHVRALAQASCEELTQENLHLQSILRASETDLREAINTLVSQYQKESDIAQLRLKIQQAQRHQQSCTATVAALTYAQQLKETLQNLQRTQLLLLQTEKLSRTPIQ